jgi:hypothetical protein
MNKKHFAETAAHYEKLHKAHTEMAAYIKAKQEGLDDDDPHKAFYSKLAEHEGAMAGHCKTMCDHNKAMESECDKAVTATDITKAAPAAAPAAAPVQKAAPTAGDPAPAAPAADPAKPADPAASASAGVAGLIKSTTDALVQKSLSTLENDPAVGDAIRKMVLEQVQAALNGTIVPTSVKAVLPTDAPDDSRLRLVPHSGQPVVDSSNVDPELQALVEI